METKEFTTVYLSKLKIDDLYSLSKSTIDCATPVSENLGDLPNATLTQLETDNFAMGVQMNKASKNVLTPQVAAKNNVRKDRFSEIKRNVTTALKGSDAEKKTAAENLKIFLEPYWNLSTKALNTQTGIIKDMLFKYNASASLKAQAATIGITAMMTGLGTVNNEFDVLYKNRNEQEANEEGPSASSLRTATTNSYSQFCTAIEQAVNFTPTATLTLLFNEIDELRKTYARLVHTDDNDTQANAGAAQ